LLRLSRQLARHRVEQAEEDRMEGRLVGVAGIVVLVALLAVRDHVFHLRAALEARQEVGTLDQRATVELVLEEGSAVALTEHNLLGYNQGKMQD